VSELRWRFWLDRILSKRSLATLGLAAASFVGWVSTQNPLFGWLMLGSGGTWAALMYYLLSTTETEATSPRPDRERVVRELEAQLVSLLPRRTVPAERSRAERRLTQLRRIVQLEELILKHLSEPPSGLSILSPEHEQDIVEFVDQAIELTRRRILLLRALQAHSADALQREIELLQQRREHATERVRAEIDELLELKRDQLRTIAQWVEDLQITELNLDQIESFLQSVAYDQYDQTVNASNVGQRIARVKSRITARKETLQELEQRIHQAGLS
jgi:hypothetical protein